MRSIAILYDLNKPGADYDALIGAIKEKFPGWWHCLDSTWLVRTTLTCVEVRDYLVDFMDVNDELLVVELTGVAAWKGFDKDCSDWLTNNL